MVTKSILHMKFVNWFNQEYKNSDIQLVSIPDAFPWHMVWDRTYTLFEPSQNHQEGDRNLFKISQEKIEPISTDETFGDQITYFK